MSYEFSIQKTQFLFIFNFQLSTFNFQLSIFNLKTLPFFHKKHFSFRALVINEISCTFAAIIHINSRQK